MATPIFPTPNASSRFWGWRGIKWQIDKTPNWSTTVQRSISGRRVAIANYATPVWHWKLTFTVLRDLLASARNASKTGKYADLQTLVGFLQQRKGSFDPFLFPDPTDRFVVGETIYVGTPAGVKDYQLLRTFGFGGTAYTEPIGALDVVAAHEIRINGTPTTAYTPNLPYDGWIHFTGSDPPTGATLTGDYSFYHRVACTKDAITFRNMAKDFWSTELEFETVRA